MRLIKMSSILEGPDPACEARWNLVPTNAREHMLPQITCTVTFAEIQDQT